MNHVPRQKTVNPTVLMRDGFALVECLALLFVVALVCLATRSLMEYVVEPLPPDSCVKGATDSPVRKIGVDQTGDRLWIFRPRAGLIQMNLTTQVVERSPSLTGMHIAAVAFSRDGSASMLCGLDDFVVLHRDGEPERTARVPQGGIHRELIVSAAISHDGGVALCSTNHGRVHGWICHEGATREFGYDLPTGAVVVRTALNRTGNRLCVMRDDGVVSFHDPATGTSDGCVLRDEGIASDMAWSQDERLIAVASLSGRVRVYEVESGRLAFELCQNHPHGVCFPMSIEISADGRWLALASTASSEVLIWSLETGHLTCKLCGHDSLVSTLQFAPTSDRIYSGSYDGTIREWSVEEGRFVRRID